MARLSKILAMPGPTFNPPPLDWRKFKDPCRGEYIFPSNWSATLGETLFRDWWNLELLNYKKKNGAR